MRKHLLRFEYIIVCAPHALRNYDGWLRSVNTDDGCFRRRIDIINDIFIQVALYIASNIVQLLFIEHIIRLRNITQS